MNIEIFQSYYNLARAVCVFEEKVLIAEFKEISNFVNLKKFPFSLIVTAKKIFYGELIN